MSLTLSLFWSAEANKKGDWHYHFCFLFVKVSRQLLAFVEKTKFKERALFFMDLLISKVLLSPGQSCRHLSLQDNQSSLSVSSPDLFFCSGWVFLFALTCVLFSASCCFRSVFPFGYLFLVGFLFLWYASVCWYFFLFWSIFHDLTQHFQLTFFMFLHDFDVILISVLRFKMKNGVKISTKIFIRCSV